jgi:hypothetical protein
MQVTLNPGNPAEVRLIAAFMQDLADLMEGTSPIQPPISNDVVVAPSGAAEVTAPKRTRAKKEAPAPAPETPEPAETPAETPEPVTHDTLRLLYGQLVAANKRDAAAAAIKSFHVKAIKELKPEDLDAVHAELLKVQAS